MGVAEIMEAYVGSQARAFRRRLPHAFAEVGAGDRSATCAGVGWKEQVVVGKFKILDVARDHFDKLGRDPETTGLIVLRVGLGEEPLACSAVRPRVAIAEPGAPPSPRAPPRRISARLADGGRDARAGIASPCERASLPVQLCVRLDAALLLMGT